MLGGKKFLLLEMRGGGGEAGARPVFPFSTALNELNIGYACQSIC